MQPELWGVTVIPANDLDGRLTLLEVCPVQLEPGGKAHVRTIATERHEDFDSLLAVQFADRLGPLDRMARLLRLLRRLLLRWVVLRLVRGPRSG